MSTAYFSPSMDRHAPTAAHISDEGYQPAVSTDEFLDTVRSGWLHLIVTANGPRQTGAFDPTAMGVGRDLWAEVKDEVSPNRMYLLDKSYLDKWRYFQGAAHRVVEKFGVAGSDLNMIPLPRAEEAMTALSGILASWQLWKDAADLPLLAQNALDSVNRTCDSMVRKVEAVEQRIAGGDQTHTAEQIAEWRGQVETMRACQLASVPTAKQLGDADIDYRIKRVAIGQSLDGLPANLREVVRKGEEREFARLQQAMPAAIARDIDEVIRKQILGRDGDSPELPGRTISSLQRKATWLRDANSAIHEPLFESIAADFGTAGSCYFPGRDVWELHSRMCQRMVRLVDGAIAGKAAPAGPSASRLPSAPPSPRPQVLTLDLDVCDAPRATSGLRR